MNQLEVLHVTTVHPRTDSRIWVKECHAIHAAGYKVGLVVADGKGSSPAEAGEGIPVFDLGPFPGFRPFRLLMSIFRTIWIPIRWPSVRLLHFHDPEVMFSALIWRLFGRQVIYDVHEDLPEQIRIKQYIPDVLRAPLSLIVRIIEKGLARFYSYIVTVTPYIAEKFKAANSRVQIVRNFPDASKFARIPNGLRKPQKDFCYVGSLSGARGLNVMLEAVEDSEWSLALAGEFSEMPAWLFETGSVAKRKNVHYAGSLDSARIPEFLSFCKCGLVLLQPTSTYIHALPIKLFEYMAAGLPFIASDFEPIRQITGHGRWGLLVDPTDIKAVRSAMKWILDNPVEASALGRAGQKAIMSGEINWASESKSLTELYRQLLGRAA